MRHFLFIFICCLSLLPAISTAEENNTLAIIVSPEQVASKHATNEYGLNEDGTKNLTKTELALIYWRKKLFWANGQRIHPVNFSANNAVRNQFSKQILNSLPESQTDYWNGLYYHGISPPHVVQSYEAALRFVAETPGAIAYIPACKVDERVKVLAWLDQEGVLSNNAPLCAN